MEPLTRNNVTKGLQIMIPLITGFFAVAGLNYMLGGKKLLLTPALNYVNSYMPLPVWGILFAICSILMASAMLTTIRRIYQFALLICIISMGIWTFVSVVAVFASDASPGGWAYSAFVFTTCIAVYRQLGHRERR